MPSPWKKSGYFHLHPRPVVSSSKNGAYLSRINLQNILRKLKVLSHSPEMNANVNVTLNFWLSVPEKVIWWQKSWIKDKLRFRMAFVQFERTFKRGVRNPVWRNPVLADTGLLALRWMIDFFCELLMLSSGDLKFGIHCNMYIPVLD